MESRNSRYRWAMLGLIWLLYFVFGVCIRSISPLISPILSDLKISFFQMGFILGAWQLTYIVFATVDGAVIDRWGLRKSLLAGVIILGLSEVLRYFVGGFVSLLLCVALIGVGGPMVSIGSPKAIALWFNGRERGLATGIYMTAPAIGGLFALSTANSVIMPLTGNSWRLTFVVYGAIAFVAGALWWLSARDTGEAGTKGGIGAIRVFASLIRLRVVQLILLMGLLSFTVNHGFDSWLPQILEARGISPATAGFTASIPLFAGILSVLIIPRITPSGARSYVIALMSGVAALALLFVATGSGISLTLGLILFGLTSVPIMSLLMLILMESPGVGSTYLGSAVGMFFCVAEVGGFTGPFVLGWVRNMTGGFAAGTLFTAGLSVLMVVMGLYLKKQIDLQL